MSRGGAFFRGGRPTRHLREQRPRPRRPENFLLAVVQAKCMSCLHSPCDLFSCGFLHCQIGVVLALNHIIDDCPRTMSCLFAYDFKHMLSLVLQLSVLHSASCRSLH